MDKKEQYHTLLEVLAGSYESLPSHPLFRSVERSNVAILGSPIREYLNQVNKFLFSGGLSYDVKDASEDDPRQYFLNDLVHHNKLNSLLYSIWVKGAIYGELLAVVTVNPSRPSHYSFSYYDKEDYYPEYLDDRLIKVWIEKDIIGEDGKEYCYRQEMDENNYYTYPLVPVSKKKTFEWEKNVKIEPHPYREIPCVLIKNTECLNSHRGKTEFDRVAIDIASGGVLLLHDALENFHFFGSPLYASVDPEDMLAKLKNRTQVLQKEPENEGGAPEVLQPNPIPEEAFTLYETLKENFFSYMGISQKKREQNTNDISSLSLRILNQDTISKAETKWSNYIDFGLTLLLEKCLRFSAIDGYTSLVNPLDPNTFTIQVTRIKPYFTHTPQETLTLLAVAENLRNLGVSMVTALKETVYQNLTEEEIRERLEFRGEN